MIVLLILGGIVIVGAVVLIIVGLRAPNTEDVLQKRLAEFSTFEGTINLEEIELAQPFTERIIYPLARKMGEMAREVGGHGGMDFIMDWRLIYCLRNGLPLDQDVYDAAAWSSIVPLSEISVRSKSQMVEVPDFTRGVWAETKPLDIVE